MTRSRHGVEERARGDRRCRTPWRRRRRAGRAARTARAAGARRGGRRWRWRPMRPPAMHDAGGGEVVGGDAGAAEVGADGLETRLEALPPATVEHRPIRVPGRPAQIPASRWSGPQDPPPPGEEQVVAGLGRRGRARRSGAGTRARRPPRAGRSSSSRAVEGAHRGTSPRRGRGRARAGAPRRRPGPARPLLHARLQPPDERLDGARAPGQLARDPTSPATPGRARARRRRSSGSGTR